MTIHIDSADKRQIIDITSSVEGHLKGSGLINVLALHTTAAVTIADLDPGTEQDYLQAIESMTPQGKWQHPHDPSHFPDHLWSALIGPGLTVPYRDGKLVLGTWQRIILIELDGPRQRTLELSFIPG